MKLVLLCYLLYWVISNILTGEDKMWEVIGETPIDSNLIIRSHRLRVPGGWIVRTITGIDRGIHAVDVEMVQTFVPDLNFKWELEKK